jgi:hypothetical protein
VSAALLLAACGGDDDGGGATTTTTELAGSATTAATSTTTTAPTATAGFEYVTDGAIVIVANASRVNGAAGVLTERLAAVGFEMTEATNSSDDVDNLATTQIFYAPGDAAAQAVAENLRLVFGGGDVTVEEVAVPALTESGNLGDGTVLVLLGNDIAGKTLEEMRPTAAADDDAPTDAGDDAPTDTGDDTGDDGSG